MKRNIARRKIDATSPNTKRNDNRMLIQHRLTVCVIDDKTTSNTPALIQSFGFDIDSYLTIHQFIDQWTLQPSCVVINTNRLDTAESHRFFELAADHPYLTIVLVGDTRPGHCKHCTQRQVFATMKPPYHPQHLNATIQSAINQASTSWAKHVCKIEFERRHASLSPRESEVYEHILRGEENKRIAAQLEISSSTVEKHRLSIVRKMNVQSPIQLLLQKYLATGTITDDFSSLQTTDLGLAHPAAQSTIGMPIQPTWGPANRTQASMGSMN